MSVACPLHVRAVAVVVAGLVLASCGSADVPIQAPSGSAAAASPSSTAPVFWPLRGTTAPNADAIKKRPIVVKVANDSAARPQTGMATADVILEIPVEGGITRYALVFQSQDPDRVGPVRSARQSDLNYISLLKAIVVHVGASQQVAAMVRDAAKSGAFVDVDEFAQAGAFERTTDRPAPYNAYTTGAKVRDAAGDKGKEKVDIPALAFDPTVKGTKAEGKDATALVIPYPGGDQLTKYTFEGGVYHRVQGGKPTTDGGKEVTPDNVVVIKTDINEIAGTADAAGAPSVDYRATGSGPVVILREGKRFDGTWSRQGNEMYKFADASGATIALKPGLTWIHIVPTAFSLD